MTKTKVAGSSKAISLTAVDAAKVRAAHFDLGSEPKILEDSIAERLLGADMPKGQEAEKVSGGAGVLLRSRFAEDRLEQAVKRGVGQYILLGAGLDSFAYRQPAWSGSLTIYEIDEPASQADKQKRLQRAGIAMPGNLTFAPIDFETTSLREGAFAAGVDGTKPAFFSCLGVLGYLNRSAVDEIFAFVAQFPPGSEIAFSFYGQPFPQEMLDFTAKRAEPLLTFIDPDELSLQLRELGFAELVALSQEEAQARYFGEGRSDGLLAPPLPLLTAAVKG